MATSNGTVLKPMHIKKVEGVIQFERQDRVLNVYVDGGKIVFEEGCDEHFQAEYTHDEAIHLLDELKHEIMNHKLGLNSLLNN